MSATTTTITVASRQTLDSSVIEVCQKSATKSLVSLSEIPNVSLQRALTVPEPFQYALRDDFPIPDITRDDEVMIRSCAVGLNPIDFLTVDYNFCLPAFPWVTGREVAGVVEKVGTNVTNVRPGERVWASTYYRDIRAACFQEFLVVPQHTVCHIPEALCFEEAACLGVPGLTAAMTLWKWLKVPMPTAYPVNIKQEGYLVVWGGSTVTGQFLIQLASQCGLNVIAITSQKTETLVRNLGARHVVTRDHRTNEDIAAMVRSIGGDLITRAVDLVGPSTAISALHTLSRTSPSILAPLSKWNSEAAVPSNVEVADVQMKSFILDPSSQKYGLRLNEMVGAGHVRIPELEVLKGGLADIVPGLELLKRGDRAGRKLVVSMGQI